MKNVIYVLIVMTIISCKPDDVSKAMLDSQFDLYENIYDWYYWNSIELEKDKNTGNVKLRDEESKNSKLELFLLKNDLPKKYTFAYQNFKVCELSDEEAMVRADRAVIFITTILRKNDESGFLRIEEVYYHHMEGFHNYGTEIPMPIEVIIKDSDIAIDSEFKAFWNKDFEYQYETLRKHNNQSN